MPLSTYTKYKWWKQGPYFAYKPLSSFIEEGFSKIFIHPEDVPHKSNWPYNINLWSNLCSLNFETSICSFSTFLIVVLFVHAREQECLPPFCELYTITPSQMPLFKLTSICAWYKKWNSLGKRLNHMLKTCQLIYPQQPT